jgi:hypothetical protein
VNRLSKRLRASLALAFCLVVAGVPASASVASSAHSATTLHSGEFCTKSRQAYYHRHGYTCRRASDGRLRLFTL